MLRDTISSEEGTHLAAGRAALPPCFCLSVALLAHSAPGALSFHTSQPVQVSPPGHTELLSRMSCCPFRAARPDPSARGITLWSPLLPKLSVKFPSQPRGCPSLCMEGKLGTAHELHTSDFPSLALSCPPIPPIPHPFSPHLCYPTLFEAVTIKEGSVSQAWLASSV